MAQPSRIIPLITEKVGFITRQILAVAAYDLRDPDQGKDYGVHGMDLYFTVQRDGSNEILTWRLMTDWHLPTSRTYLQAISNIWFCADGLGDITHHKTANNSTDTSTDTSIDAYNKHCLFLGRPCITSEWSDLSHKWFDVFVADPSQLWPMMEAKLTSIENEATEVRG